MFSKKSSEKLPKSGLLILLFLLFIFQLSCSQKSSASNAIPAVPVKVAKAVAKEMPVQISSVGSFEPVLSVGVKSQVSGRILKVNFKEGDYVQKGQLLFILDSKPFEETVKQAEAALAQSKAGLKVAQANLRNAQAQLGTAKSNILNQTAGVSSAEGNLESLKAQSDDALSLLNKQQALFKEGIIAERDLEVAETGYKSSLAKYQQALAQVKQAQVVAKTSSSSQIDQANSVVQQMQSQIEAAEAQIGQNQAALDNAKVQLSYCRIVSPIGGRTGNLNITEGNVVNANDATPIVSINSLSPIYATFSIPEKYLSDIQKYFAAGVVRVEAQIDAQTKRGGTLSSIDNEVNQSNGTIQLKASFLNDDMLLYPGKFVNITLDLTSQSGAIVVPSVAVQNGQQGQFVYVVKPDQTVEARKVTLDRTIGDDAVISDGLKEGETVVTDGQLRLGVGSKVEFSADNQSNSNPQNNSNGGGK